ncbi:MAG: hypothetical protein QM756_04620 [Polyangiaceae bacterium]
MKRALRALAFGVVLGGLTSRPAGAALPTVPECLSASEASIALGNERKHLAERDELLICAQPSCPEIVREECERRLEDANRRIATVVFDVRDGEDRPLTAITVLIDGRMLEMRATDEPVPVDPGKHHFTFRAGGKPELSRTFTIREGERDRPIQIRLGVEASPPAPQAGRDHESRISVQRMFALGSAGLAVAGLATGSVLGVLAIKRRNAAREVCPGACADRAGVDAWEEARRRGNESTVAFVVAGVAGAAAAVLWFSLPTQQATSTRLGFGLGSATVTGAF